MDMNKSPQDQFVKFHANQAGPFTSDNNVIDVTIPGGAVYNLRDSYLQIYAEISSTDAAIGGVNGVYNGILEFANQSAHFPNSALVKNCEVSSSARGAIESIRRADILSQAKHLVSRGRRTDQTENYLSANVVSDPNGNVFQTPFVQKRQSGTTLSSYQEAPIPIRLGDLMESCETLMYDGRKLGDLRFRFELNAPGGANPKIVAAAAGGLTAGQPLYPGWSSLNDIPENQATITSLTLDVGAGAAQTRGAREDLGGCPWYVGQRVNVTATGAGNGPPANINTNTIITGIAVADTGVLTFTLAASIGTTGAGATYEDVEFNAIPGPDTISATFNRVELVAKRIGNPPPMSMPIEWAWRTYETTEDTGPQGVQNFNRQYVMSPESDAVMITFPDAQADVFSINTDINAYRLAINQVETTDRDVVVGPTALDVSPLALDRLSDLYDKMGLSISNLTLNGGVSDQKDYSEVYNQANRRQTIFGCKMPQTAQQKYLGVKISLGANQVDKIALFQSSPRGLSY
jgi:hypothetical protein